MVEKRSIHCLGDEIMDFVQVTSGGKEGVLPGDEFGGQFSVSIRASTPFCQSDVRVELGA